MERKKYGKYHVISLVSECYIPETLNQHHTRGDKLKMALWEHTLDQYHTGLKK